MSKGTWTPLSIGVRLPRGSVIRGRSTIRQPAPPLVGCGFQSVARRPGTSERRSETVMPSNIGRAGTQSNPPGPPRRRDGRRTAPSLRRAAASSMVDGMTETTSLASAVPFRLDPATHPALTRMAEALRAKHRFAADIVDRGAALFGSRWADEFEAVVGALFPTPEAVAAAVKGYAAFAMQSMRLQAAFEVEGEYKAKSYD